MKLQVFPIIVCGIAALLAGCGSSPTPTVSLIPTPAVTSLNGTVQLTAKTALAPNKLTWTVNGVPGGNATLGTVSTMGLYTAPSSGSAQVVTVAATDTEDAGVTATAQISVIGAITVANTANPQTAAYTVDMPAAGTVAVEFGPTNTYGRSTWNVTATGPGPVTVLVAGLPANSTGHMRADVSLGSSLTWMDTDHSFAFGQSIPTPQNPVVTAVTTPGKTPQPGVELVTAIFGGAIVYDLAGNVIWGYPLSPTTGASDQMQGAKLLPNGDVLLDISPGNNWTEIGPVPSAATITEIREVDLGSNTVRSMTVQKLQDKLNNLGYKDGQGNIPQILALHHEITYNPTNGHWLMLGSYQQLLTPDGYTSPLEVLGDIVFDVDPANDYSIDFLWNEFDHLDVNRHPYLFPDWTHSNAIVYSPDDGNILVSIRHQSWVVKVDYQDAKGDGSILWRFGYEGDFTLTNAAGPQDWQWNQHQPAFTTSNTTGTFGLTMMDNGDTRMFPPGFICPDGTAPPCLYSRTPIFTINETNMTATVANRAPLNYTFWGGDAELLPNGNQGQAFPGLTINNIPTAVAAESTVSETPQLVWSMSSPGGGFYRAHRIGSIYPGVNWTK